MSPEPSLEELLRRDLEAWLLAKAAIAKASVRSNDQRFQQPGRAPPP
jgi:hypothetical protein